MRKGVRGVCIAALAGASALPGVASAQIADPQPGQGAPVAKLPDSDSEQATPQVQTIVPDADFEAALPKLSDDINAPLEPVKDFQAKPADTQPADTKAAAPNGVAVPPPVPVPTAPAVTNQIESLPPAAAESSEFAQPLEPLASFKVTPSKEDYANTSTNVTIRYATEVRGLDKIRMKDEFDSLSALKKGKGKAANAAMVSARAREDEKLAVRLMQSLGYYDGTAVSTLEKPTEKGGSMRAVITASTGQLYRLGTITIESDPTVPPGLLDRELNLNPGDPIQADRVQGAEANVSLRLPQQGYPFVKLGERDIILDDATHIGDYTLPVTLGPRSSFGKIVTEGRKPVFDADHIELLKRYKPGEIYDSRKVDDLRQALIATSLFATVSVEPQQTNEPGPDDTQVVDLLVKQTAGKPRTIAAQLGYSTGQGIRLEGSWTSRNMFPPEGAIIGTGVLGTQEQGITGTFRRSNAGQRDRTLTIAASLDHQDYDAYEAYTSSLSIRMSRDSTPIWQKRWTYYYGVELVGTNEDQWNYSVGARDRGTWLIAALPLFLGYDTSDNLLNPTKGYRIKVNLSPETSVRGAARPYERFMLETDGYYPVTGSLVIAGKARVGSIAGIARNDLPPSRRYYSGGGGSVRGFGYQDLGPRSPDGQPVGGRSFNEFSVEARYRFGNFGIVPFLDAGQVYEGIYPTGQNLRFGAGIGGRLYTNFGPIRVDVATPIARKPGESKIALYISIGQAF